MNPELRQMNESLSADLFRHGCVLEADSLQFRLDDGELIGNVTELVHDLSVAGLSCSQLTSQILYQMLTFSQLAITNTNTSASQGKASHLYVHRWIQPIMLGRAKPPILGQGGSWDTPG